VLNLDLSDQTETQIQSNLIQTADAALDGVHHEIVMDAVEMPDGMYAYRMTSHIIDGSEDVTEIRYGSNPQPTIPGPTLIFTEGDDATITLNNKVSCDDFPDVVDGDRSTPEISRIGIHVHGVHYDPKDDGTPKRTYFEDSSAKCEESVSYDWRVEDGSRGTWPYHDHTFLSENGGEDLGLFGTVIVNPRSGQINGIVSSEDNTEGEIVKVKTGDLKKDYVLWMTSTETLGRSIFYGMEIDNDASARDVDSQGIGRQTPLWVNPTLLATEDDLVRFHILGMGDEFHAWHLHGHRWIEPTEESGNIIDVRTIGPLERHTFIVKASDNGTPATGTEDWMYHCHVFAHMKEGMAGKFRVLPAGSDDTLPDVGAVFTISDEPGLWFKTLNAGIVDDLDPREGTGFPLDFLGGDVADSEGRSLAIIKPRQSVIWNMKDSQTLHTITSLI